MEFQLSRMNSTTLASSHELSTTSRDSIKDQLGILTDPQL